MVIPGDFQGSGQNGYQTIENDEEKPISESPSLSEKGSDGSQTNENIYESLPLPENPGNGKDLKEDAISHVHPGGN